MLHVVYVVRELILELLSEVVLAAPPSTLPTEASVTNTKKHSQTGGNSRDFFLGLFEHSAQKCKMTPPVWRGRPPESVFESRVQNPNNAQKCNFTPPQFGGGVKKAVPCSVLLHRNAGTVTPK